MNFGLRDYYFRAGVLLLKLVSRNALGSISLLVALKRPLPLSQEGDPLASFPIEEESPVEFSGLAPEGSYEYFYNI